MRKVVITEFGDESKLAIVEDDLPDPAAGEVQLSVEYSIVSGSDVNMRRGTYPFQRKAPPYTGLQRPRQGASERSGQLEIQNRRSRHVSFKIRRTGRVDQKGGLLGWLESGKISVPIKATFRLEEIQKAHREYASSTRTGSIVIEMSR
jgi:NADPH:quinone reductase-like Zn-dependent oxidoreductase